MQPYYQDEWVTLYLGDCLEVGAWLAADVLVTDPPYGIAYAPHRKRFANPDRNVPIQNDHDFECSRAAVRAWGAKPMAVFASHVSLARTHAAVSEQLGARVRVAVWHKINRNDGVGQPWLGNVEFVVMGVTEYPRRFVSAVIPTRAYMGNPACNADADAYLHPSQKRTSGMSAVIDAMPPGVVADPFAGSGSTLVAAKALGRKSVGVELEERYCEIAANRLAQDVLDFVN